MFHNRNARGGRRIKRRFFRFSRKKRLLLLPICAAAVLAAFIGVQTGRILPNSIYLRSDSVLGVDVSKYQGSIDWETLQGEGIRFAYIKATEGSAYTDPRFAENFANAQKTQLAVGAYHFLSFDSPGASQAALFLKTVPEGASLPAAVDIELYGDYRRAKPAKEKVTAILDDFLRALERDGKDSPVLYFTGESYRLFYDGRYRDNPLWIRDIVKKPAPRGWTFWQYSDKGRLSGFRGEERFIDLDVFCGTPAQFEAFLRP